MRVGIERNGVGTKKGLKSPCAQREIRTPTPFRALPPQDSVSTSFTIWAKVICDSAGVRTQDPLIKSQMLYQLSYRIIFANNVPFIGTTKVRGFSRMYKRMSKIFAAFFILALGLLLSPFQASASDPGTALAKADQLYESDKYTEAIDLYTDLYQDGYYSQKMLYRLSFMHEKLDNYPEAVYYLRKTIQEYGDDEEQSIDQKIRGIIRTNGGRRLFTSNEWNFRLFFRNYQLIIYIIFGIAIAWLCFNYLSKRKRTGTPQFVATIFAWMFFVVTGSLLFWRSFMVPTQAVIIDATSFYAEPSYAAERFERMLSLGELVTIDDREDIWCEVSAGGNAYWIPRMALREL